MKAPLSLTNTVIKIDKRNFILNTPAIPVNVSQVYFYYLIYIYFDVCM